MCGDSEGNKMAAAIARINARSNHTNALNLLKTSLNISHIVLISYKPHSESWSNVIMVIWRYFCQHCVNIELRMRGAEERVPWSTTAAPSSDGHVEKILDTRNIWGKHHWKKSLNCSMLTFGHPYGYKIPTFCVSTLSHARFSWSITLFSGCGRPAVVCLPLVAIDGTTQVWSVTCIPTS